MAWVNDLHPAFRTGRPADLVAQFQYDDVYWRRELPWVGADDVRDVPIHAASGGTTSIRSAYYDVELDGAGRHAVVRLAMGFRVGGVLRALYAALLPRRDACLVRATLRDAGDGVMLVCDDAGDEVVAVADRGEWISAEPTPFHPGTSARRRPPRPIVAIEAAGDGARPVDAAARLLEPLVIVDHSTPLVERALDLLTRAALGAAAVPDDTMRSAGAAR
jgi:hypothetical protein